MGATDGKIGKVKEFYLDDETWTVRYLIVEIGSLFFKRKVLISTQALLPPDWDNKIFLVNLTIQQIENSPDIDAENPISRQHEMELNKHYSWEDYWKKDDRNNDKYLRSTEKLKNYRVNASNGEVGKITDFLVDENTWEINFFVVDAFIEDPAKEVLIMPRSIKDMIWKDAIIIVDATTKKIKNSPEYNTGQIINEDYKMKLIDYYESSLVQR